jgi:hypothetical protein
MSDDPEAEFQRLALRRSQLISVLMAARDNAENFAIELEPLSRRDGLVAVTTMLAEAVRVRDVCDRALKRLQRQTVAGGG